MEDTMNQATYFSRRMYRAVACLYRISHAGALILGMVAMLYLLNGSLDVAANEEGHVVATQEIPAAAVVALADSAESNAVVSNRLSREMMKVSSWVSRRYRVSTMMIDPALLAAEESGKQIGVDPLLLVAMMAVESGFNPFAESNVGAQGLMQVIPRFHLDKLGDEGNNNANALFDPALNVRVGALVLHEGLRRYGDLQAALQYYGGAPGDPSAAYARKVMAMKQRLATAVGRKGGAV
jgi:soluble lytic murein transglycosylase-like protein